MLKVQIPSRCTYINKICCCFCVKNRYTLRTFSFSICYLLVDLKYTYTKNTGQFIWFGGTGSFYHSISICKIIESRFINRGDLRILLERFFLYRSLPGETFLKRRIKGLILTTQLIGLGSLQYH